MKEKKIIELCQFFNSFQGEYPDIGGIYTFVRFIDCNLRCPWCHAENEAYDYVLNDEIKVKSLVQINTNNSFIYSFDPVTNSPTYSKILSKAVVEFDSYVRLSFESGVILDVTYDHMLYVKNSALSQPDWVSSIEINTGDYVMSSSGSWIKVISKEVISNKKKFICIKTSTKTYTYAGILHHNCDTDVVMKTNKVYIKLDEILSNVMKTRGILFTGGEPALYYNEINTILLYLLQQINEDKLFLTRIGIETNGTRLIKLYNLLLSYVESISKVQVLKPLLFYVWSPKFYNDESTAFSFKILNEYFDHDTMKDLYIKIVYSKDTESTIKKFLDTLVNKCDSNIITRVSLMPQGITAEEILSNIKQTMEVCSSFGINISPRVHLLTNFP